MCCVPIPVVQTNDRCGLVLAVPKAVRYELSTCIFVLILELQPAFFIMDLWRDR